MPVAMVELLDTTDVPEPSDGVALIRDFIRQEFDRMPNRGVDLQALGPSPSHADIYLIPASSEETRGRRFSRKHHSRAGYDRYEVLYNQQDVPSDRAAQAFLAAALLEVDLFYRIAQVETYRGLRWQELRGDVAALIDSQRRRDLGGRLSKVFRSSRRLNDVFIDLVEFESQSLSYATEVATDFEQTYRSGTETHLRELVEGKVKLQRQYPVAQTRALVEQV
jgi:hypothetical protein